MDANFLALVAIHADSAAEEKLTGLSVDVLDIGDETRIRDRVFGDREEYSKRQHCRIE